MINYQDDRIKQRIGSLIMKLTSICNDLDCELILDTETSKLCVQNDLDDKVYIDLQMGEIIFDDTGKMNFDINFIFGAFDNLKDKQGMKHICELIKENMTNSKPLLN